MIKLNLTDPVHLSLGGGAAITTFMAMGGQINAKTVAAVATAFTSGVASASKNTASPNVAADSHIVTPYVNNIE